MISQKLNITRMTLQMSCMLFLFLFIHSSSVYGQINQSGSINELIRNIRETMPGNGSNSFVIPGNVELQNFQTIVSDLRQKNLGVIQSKLLQYNYEFLKFTDTESNRVFYILKEKSPISKGWGTYVYFPNSTDSLSIEVPHPIWDSNSWSLGIKTFISTNASWFLMAGTHRYANSDTSSDVAHVTQSVFHVMHKVIGTPIAIQVHGYSRSNSIYTGYPDIIISNGTLYPPSKLFDLKAKFESKGFSTGVFSFSTYQSLWRLGATTNTQGQWSNSNNKLFVHIEFEYFIRNSNQHTDNSVTTLRESFATITSIEYEKSINTQNKKYQINQNFPNPFNNSTFLSFEISQPLQVDVTVYNVIGEVVYQELGREYETGLNYLTLNLINSRSGIYFVQLQSKLFNEIKKITLLK